MYKAKHSVTGVIKSFKTIRARQNWQDKCDNAYGRYVCFPYYDEETKNFIAVRQGLIASKEG